MRHPIPSAYEQLFLDRYHGAHNHRAVLYHALVAASQAFRFYDDGGPTFIQNEGFEDLDLHGDRFGHEYVQVKNHGEPLNFGQIEDVLRSFVKVLKLDKDARFVLVSGSGFVDELTRYINGVANSKPPAALRDRAKKVCRDVKTAESLLQRTKFRSVPQAELEAVVERDVLHRFEIDNQTQHVYIRSLLLLLAEKAGDRQRITKDDLETLRQSVWEELARGPDSVAVRSGLVEGIRFATDDRVGDFYEGRSARAAHIAAALDIARPESQSQISRALSQAQVCAIIASSGQGKSTLAFRHAARHGGDSASFLVRDCLNSEQAGSIAEYLKGRLRLGLPLMVIIDNLDSRTQAWHILAERLIGEPVSFIVTSREEDWKRYGQSFLSFNHRSVRPTLELDEARQIFQSLKEAGRVHDTVVSAEWAWERLRHQSLLIEFIFLVTQGQLLEDRLRQQIHTLEDEDPGKLETLRLVSTADKYGTRLPRGDLLAKVVFQRDAIRSLESLSDEYLTVDGQVVSGLHPVRSGHIADILLPDGRTETVVDLCSFIGKEALPEFVSTVLIDGDIRVDDVLSALAGRCYDTPDLISSLWKACQKAAQERYVADNDDVLRRARERFGKGGVVALAHLGLPNQMGEANGLLNVFDEDGQLVMQGLVNDLQPRDPENSLDARFLSALFNGGRFEDLLENPAATLDLINCCVTSKTDRQVLELLLGSVDWRTLAWQLPLGPLCALAVAVHRIDPESYSAWVTEFQSQLESRFKLLTESLAIAWDGDAATIRFCVDVSPNARDGSDQAVERVNALAALFPTVQLLRTEPVFPHGDERLNRYIGAYKEIERSKIYHEVDVAPNRAWNDALMLTLAADGWHSWHEAYSILERDSLTMLEYVLGLLHHAIDDVPRPTVQQLAAEVLPRWGHAWRNQPDPPASATDSQRRTVGDPASKWCASTGNCVNQGVDISLGQRALAESLRLLDFNAREALKGVEFFHGALSEARKMAGLSEIPRNTAKVQALFQALRLAILYLESGLPKAPNASSACKAWQREKSEEVLTALAGVRDNLPEEDRSRLEIPDVILEDRPDADDDDTPFRSIVVGLRIRSFQSLEAELHDLLGRISQALPDFQGYLFAVPIHRNGRLVSARRAFCASLAAILRGELEPEPINVFPVDVPILAGVSIGSIDTWIPAEDLLCSDVLEALSRAAEATAQVRESRLVLSEEVADERSLLQRFEERVQSVSGPQSPLILAVARLKGFVPSAASVEEWNRFVEEADLCIRTVLEEPEQLFLAIQNLWAFRDRYMDAAYPLQ